MTATKTAAAAPAYVDVSESLHATACWLDNQDETLTFGLKSAQDALKLHAHWEANQALTEYADDAEADNAVHRIEALGYDPIARANELRAAPARAAVEA